MKKIFLVIGIASLVSVFFVDDIQAYCDWVPDVSNIRNNRICPTNDVKPACDFSIDGEYWGDDGFFSCMESSISSPGTGWSSVDRCDCSLLTPHGELFGYAWTGTIGWISMNSKNCDPDGNFATNDGGPGCPTWPGDFPDPPYDSLPYYYNVKVSPETGHFSGYGWSENVGWVNFESATTTPDNNDFNTSGLCQDSTCTSANNCTACYSPVGGATPIGNIYGWAHVIALGDDGWISLNNDNLGSAQNYGVKYDINTHELYDYAWSGANSAANYSAGLGWLSFNCSNPSEDCSVSDYKVMGLLNIKPSVTSDQSLAIRELPCGTSDGLDGACSTNCENHPEIYWDYDDPEGYDQASYEIVFDRDNNPNNSNEYDRKTENNDTDHYIPTDEGVTIKYGTTYYVHIKVWDNFGAESDWLDFNFTTRDHAYPDASLDFFMEEGSASAEEEILFWDTSIYYFDSTDQTDIPGAPGNLYVWTSLDASSIADANTATSTVIFPSEANNQTMNLQVTDNDNFSCSTSTSIYINKKLPSWKEVR